MEKQINQEESNNASPQSNNMQGTPKSEDKSKTAAQDNPLQQVQQQPSAPQSQTNLTAQKVLTHQDSPEQNDLLQKVKALENKVSFYEREHGEFQNKLLQQRSSYEDDIKKLKRRLLENQNSDAAKEYALDLYGKVEVANLAEQLAAAIKQNEQLLVENTKLQDQIQAMSEVQIDQKQDFKSAAVSARVVNEEMDQVVKERIMQTMSMISQQCELEDQAIALNEPNKALEEGYQDKLQKLQKKITDFETYLEEKDKTLLEQENQLSDLQDQIHEYIKSEEVSKTQHKEQQKKIDELMRELKLQRDQYELKIQDFYHQLAAKDGSLSDAWGMASEKEKEIQQYIQRLKETEDSFREQRNNILRIQEDYQSMQQRLQENNEEMEQIKNDFQQILNFKNELEVLIEEQTSHIEMKNKKLHLIEETLRFKESELEKKDSLLRRMTTGTDEMKKKLASAEMKLRQISQTTIRDMKAKLKDQLNEIDVLKEMVKSSNKQAKAKDIDIQRLSKKIQRLEKLTDLNKGLLPQDNMSQMKIDEGNNIIEEENEHLESDGYITPMKHQKGDLGLNPANYSVEDEVQMELLQAQQQRQFNIKPSVKKGNMPSNYRNSKQKELEEAQELDRMLEQERRNQSQDIFQKKYDEKFDQHYNNISIPNYKNTSSGMKGVFGGGNSGVDDTFIRGESRYDGMLPNLNQSKRECKNILCQLLFAEIEQELMNEINDSMRKDKYMTPNLQGGKAKVINKLNAAAYAKQTIQNNAPYFHERNGNNSKQINKKML